MYSPLSLSKGQRVFIYSIAKGDFSVNFVGANGYFLFHLNPRFGEKQVILYKIRKEGYSF